MKIIIPMLCRSKKNSEQMIWNHRTNKPMIIQSKLYLEFERDCGYFLHRYAKHIDYPVNLKCTFYVPDRRVRDLTNLENAIADILIKYGVIKDDNYNIVAGWDGSRIIYEKRQRRNDYRNWRGTRMLELTEKQKQELIKKQDHYSLKQFAIKYDTTPKDVYDYYSNLVDSGEFIRLWKKPTPQGFTKGWGKEKYKW